jgi:hypothetical protein
LVLLVAAILLLAQTAAPALSVAPATPVTVSDVTVYFSGFDAPPAANPQVISVVGPDDGSPPTVADAYEAAAGTPMPIPPLPAALLYTYNGAYATKSVYDQEVGNDDLVEFFYVPDSTQNYAYVTVDPSTAVIIEGRLKAKNAFPDSEELLLESTSLNYASPVIDRNATLTATRATGIGYDGYIVSGLIYNLSSFVPVDVVSSFTGHEWDDAIETQLKTDIIMGEAAANSGEITGQELDNLKGAIEAAQTAVDDADTDAQGDAILALGKLVYEEAHSPDARAKNITFNQYLGTEVPFDPNLSYVGSYEGQAVDAYVYDVIPNDGSGDVFYGSSVTLSVDTGIPFDPYATHSIATNDPSDIISGDTITFTNGTEKLITVTITSSGPSPATRAYRFRLFVKIPSGGGTNPMAVDGYLPVGQYANNTAYGSISLDGENKLIYASRTDYDDNVKGIRGYESNGVSLGAGAGYVQYEFDPDTPLTNDPSHPYGVDFVIYGNAVNSNSEAGAVKVSTDGKIWYELAGALYYDDITQRDIDVCYRLTSGVGVEYQFGPAGFTPDPNKWKFFAASSKWWPVYDPVPAGGGNYGESSGINGPYSPAMVPVTGISYTSNPDLITYRNVTLVEGTRRTNTFPFGYADTHPNGVNYGTAVNPYAFPGAGGDGFDLSWAVDAAGEPYAFGPTEEIRFVRVYTASAIDPNNPDAFTPPDIFGEISTEVLGVYTPTNGGSGSVTDSPTVTVGGHTLSELVDDKAATVTTVGEVTYYDASEYSATYLETEAVITASAASVGTSVYINSNTSGSIEVDFSAESKIVRIIAKDSSTGRPSVIVIKLA